MSATGVFTDLQLQHNGDLLVRTYQDVEDIIDANKRSHLMGKQIGDFRAIADIPNNIAVMWLNEEHARGNTGFKLYGAEWNAFVKRKIADADWAYLRLSK